MSCTSAAGMVVRQQLFHYTYNSQRYWPFPASTSHIWFGFASHLHFCLIVVVFWLINNATTNPPVVKFICKKSRTRPSSLQQAIAISFLQLVTGRPRRQGSLDLVCSSTSLCPIAPHWAAWFCGYNSLINSSNQCSSLISVSLTCKSVQAISTRLSGLRERFWKEVR